jgi:hypothetical protein
LKIVVSLLYVGLIYHINKYQWNKKKKKNEVTAAVR